MAQRICILAFCISYGLFFGSVAISADSADPCSGKSIGEATVGGAICAGTYNGRKYLVTPGGCTDTNCTNPSGSDSLFLKYQSTLKTTGATNSTDGLSNTHTLTNLVSTDRIAAQFCQNMYGGNSGWFLPAKDELNYLYTQKAAGKLFGFAWYNYWSSTENNFNSAWSQSFGENNLPSGFTNKTSGLPVRCVHRY